LTNGIKITVIAADFQESIEEELKRKRLPRRERIKPGEDLEVPTFLRRSREVESEQETRE